MSWIQLKVYACQSETEQLSEYFEALGALAVTFLDAKDQPILEPGVGETPLWQDVIVQALFPADQDQFVRSQLEQSLQLKNYQPQLEILEDKDWSRSWMDDYQPMRFGKRLWVCPSWLTPPDSDAVNLMLDPGLAFGTGTHPTTSLCLEWIDQIADSVGLMDKTVIDFGCGSGILALAACALGASRLYAIDNDPQAICATEENFKRNQLPKQQQHMDVVLASTFHQQSVEADVLIANILAGPIIELVSRFVQLVTPGGMIGLSGILDSQLESVLSAYRPFFQIESVEHSEEWVFICAKRLID